MILIRSLLYQVLFIPWTVILSIAYLPLLAAPRRLVQRAARFWINGAILLQKTVLGLRYEIHGRENLPDGPVLLAVKHQSAWETMIFHHLLDDPTFVLKRELLKLPFIGWYLTKTGQIAIDRDAGMKAMNKMLDGAKAAAAERRQIIVFPEGHRQPPGHAGTYHPGVALLYSRLHIPLVPVALNSGLFWPRNALMRRPGTITLAFLPQLPEGLASRAMLAEIESRIETATRSLEAEAVEGNPRLAKALAGPVDNRHTAS
jgi:1-acyl-sn-glycerol-3-phosphate acyltransferase